jgi:hypothetical protein
VENGRLVVGFLPPASNESMRGIVKRLGGRVEPITDWEGLKDRAWAARVAEINDVLEEDSRRHRLPESDT